MNQKGYSTVFFALMILAFLGVFSLCANTLMQMIQSNEQMRQASLASRTMLSYYDDVLEKDYGLMAYNQNEVKAEAMFAPYFHKDWKVTPTAHLGQLSSFQTQALALGKIGLAEEGIAALTEQFKNSSAQMNGQTNSNGDEPTKPAVNYSGDGSERKKSGLSKNEKSRARSLKSRLGQSTSKNWQTKNGGEIELKAYEARYKFDRKSAEQLNIAEKAVMVAYLKNHFNNYVQWQKSPEGIKNSEKRCFQGGELEFILQGQLTASSNQLWVNGKIFAIREVVNLTHILQSQEKKTITGSLATLVCALFPFAEPAVQAGLITLWASIESGYEISLLLDGKSIPAVKLNGGDWYTDLESGKGTLPEKNNTEKTNQINYEGFLTLMLMAQNDGVTAERAMTLIELNLKKSGHDLKDLNQMVTSHRVWVKGKTGKEISFEDGYMQNKAAEGQSNR